MLRPSIAGLVCASLVAVLLAGCETGSGTTTAPEGHDGKSATGHAGGTPAGGPTSPQAQADAKKAASK
jgi:uncharacterized lipoprotein